MAIISFIILAILLTTMFAMRSWKNYKLQNPIDDTKTILPCDVEMVGNDLYKAMEDMDEMMWSMGIEPPERDSKKGN